MDDYGTGAPNKGAGASVSENQNRNLYIHNVPREATEDDLKEFFKHCGVIERVQLKVNQKVGPHAVYAFVLFKSAEEAKFCHDTMNGSTMRGRQIRVEFQRNSKYDEDKDIRRGSRTRGRGGGDRGLGVDCIGRIRGVENRGGRGIGVRYNEDYVGDKRYGNMRNSHEIRRLRKDNERSASLSPSISKRPRYGSDGGLSGSCNNSVNSMREGINSCYTNGFQDPMNVNNNLSGMPTQNLRYPGQSAVPQNLISPEGTTGLSPPRIKISLYELIKQKLPHIFRENNSLGGTCQPNFNVTMPIQQNSYPPPFSGTPMLTHNQAINPYYCFPGNNPNCNSSSSFISNSSSCSSSSSTSVGCNNFWDETYGITLGRHDGGVIGSLPSVCPAASSSQGQTAMMDPSSSLLYVPCANSSATVGSNNLCTNPNNCISVVSSNQLASSNNQPNFTGTGGNIPPVCSLGVSLSLSNAPGNEQQTKNGLYLQKQAPVNHGSRMHALGVTTSNCASNIVQSTVTNSGSMLVNPSYVQPDPSCQRDPAMQSNCIGQQIGGIQPVFSAPQVTGPAWIGTLARNEKKRVHVHLFNLQGTCTQFINQKLQLLNVSHRSKWEEVAGKTLLAVCYLQAAQPEQNRAFYEYIQYFLAKERAGVATLDQNHYIYLVPPGIPLVEQYKPANTSDNILIGLIGPSAPQPLSILGVTGNSMNQANPLLADRNTVDSQHEAQQNQNVAFIQNPPNVPSQAQHNSGKIGEVANWMAHLSHMASYLASKKEN